LWNIAVRLIITRFPTVLERRQIAITKSDVKELKDFESLLVNRLSGLHEIERTDESAIEDDRLLITESIKLLRNKVGV
jgi:hypothetical protein